MIGFIIGLVLGTWFGVMIMALIFAAREDDRRWLKRKR